MVNNIAEETTKYEVGSSAYVYDNNYIILLSKGVNTVGGYKVLKNALIKCFGRKYEFAFKDKKVLVCTMSEYEIDEKIKRGLITLGFLKENVIILNEKAKNIETVLHDTNVDFIYVSEGNTFKIANMLQMTGAFNYIVNKIAKGEITYIGASAGAVLCSTDFGLYSEWDDNVVGLFYSTGMNILPKEYGATFVVPHYTKKQLDKWVSTVPRYKVDRIDTLINIPENRSVVYRISKDINS